MQKSMETRRTSTIEYCSIICRPIFLGNFFIFHTSINRFPETFWLALFKMRNLLPSLLPFSHNQLDSGPMQATFHLGLNATRLISNRRKRHCFLFIIGEQFICQIIMSLQCTSIYRTRPKTNDTKVVLGR